MVTKAKAANTLNPNDPSSIFTVANKKFIQDPLLERRALADLLGYTESTDNNVEQTED